MKIRPLTNNVLIEVHKINETAMVMVDERESQIEKATVLDYGDDVTLVKKGDIILYKRYNIDEIEVDGQKFVLIPEDDVKAIIL